MAVFLTLFLRSFGDATRLSELFASEYFLYTTSVTSMTSNMHLKFAQPIKFRALSVIAEKNKDQVEV